MPIRNLEKLKKYSLPYLLGTRNFWHVLLADEGINGTIAGTRNSIKDLYQWFCDQPNLNQLQIKYSEDTSIPFHRLKVRIKKR